MKQRAAVRQDLAEADRLGAEQETILHHLQDENAKLERENDVHIKAVKEISDLQEKNRALQSQIGEIDISVANLKKERDILEKKRASFKNASSGISLKKTNQMRSSGERMRS